MCPALRDTMVDVECGKKLIYDKALKIVTQLRSIYDILIQIG